MTNSRMEEGQGTVTCTQRAAKKKYNSSQEEYIDKILRRHRLCIAGRIVLKYTNDQNQIFVR